MPEIWEDAVTYTLLGTPGIDDRLGNQVMLGDIDADGRDDLLITGASESPRAYLVLASSLRGRTPGVYQIESLASHTFTLNGWSYSEDRGYDGYEAGGVLRAGELYLGNPVDTDPTLPMAYRIPWATLATKPVGTYDPRDVADATFVGTDPAGVNDRVCDLNGDGAADLLLSGKYMFLGPLGNGNIDVDTVATKMAYLGTDIGTDNGGCSPLVCRDLNRDGFDDLLARCTEYGTGDTLVNVYYGTRSISTTGTFDYFASDVSVRFRQDSDIAAMYVYASSESIGDWNRDGNVDLAVHATIHYGSGGYWTGAYVFFGGNDFFVPGTMLTQDDAAVTMGTGADVHILNSIASVSLGGDLNGDGAPEFIVGRPGFGDAYRGRVYIRYCPLEPGQYDLDAAAETTYDGAVADFDDVQLTDGEYLGESVLASGDVDGSGTDDLILSGRNYIVESDGVGAVHVVLR